MFLTNPELIELSGYRYKAKQISWLLENGYKFSVRCDGFPRVLRSHVERVLGGSIAREREEAPDIEALRSALNG